MMRSLHDKPRLPLLLILMLVLLLTATITSAISHIETKYDMTLTSANVVQNEDKISILFDNLTTKTYANNVLASQGNFVKYHYHGFIPSIHAHHITAEKMVNQFLLINQKNGKELFVGAIFSISPNRNKIYTVGCNDLICYLKVLAWPSGKTEFTAQLPGNHLFTAEKLSTVTIHPISGKVVLLTLPCPDDATFHDKSVTRMRLHLINNVWRTSTIYCSE